MLYTRNTEVRLVDLALDYVVNLITPDPTLFTTAVNGEREGNYSPNTTFLIKAFLLQNSKTFLAVFDKWNLNIFNCEEIRYSVY